MDPLHRSDEDSLLATTNRSFPSDSINVLEPDQRFLRARRKKSTISCRQLCVVFAAFVVLLTLAGSIFLIYTLASGFYEWVREPHQFAFTTDHTTSVIKSYYGERVSHFDIVANVYVRFGKQLASSESTGNDSKPELPSEQEMFGEWESIFSEVIYSSMDINSTTKIFHKTVELPISHDVLSRMYQPHTYFPQIVNTFVVVPSDPDPAFSLPRPPTLTAFDSTDAIRLDPAYTSWTQYPLGKLVRPVDPQLDTIDSDDTSRWRNISASLDAFHDTAAVREFALWPVQERWTSWSRLDPSNNGTNETTNSIFPVPNEVDERKLLHVRRNASLKIKTSTWISMARQTPVYDLKQYLFYRDMIKFNNGMRDITSHTDSDQLNQLGPHIFNKDFHSTGHAPSHLVQNASLTDASNEKIQSESEAERDLAFYGPSVSLHGHAAGPYDWMTLPRVNASLGDHSEQTIVPWRIAFELQSNLKSFAMETTSDFIKNPKSKPDEHPINFAYNEEKALESRELWHTILGHHNGSSRRPILRAMFRFAGHLIQFPGLILLQIMFVYTRNTSAGISILPNLLRLFLPMIRVAYQFRSGSLFLKGANAIGLLLSLSAVWLWARLWWGIEFQWGGWNALLPVGMKKNKPTHSERRSKRVDSQFTWFQRGLFVVVLTICMAHVHKLPDLISSTHRYTQLPTSTSSPPSSYIGKLLQKISESIYTKSFAHAVDLMATTSQILLNKRLGCYGGSYPSFAWAEFVSMILIWAPTVLHSIFGRYNTSDPVHTWVVVAFFIKGIRLWQALNYPVVNQDEEEDE